MGSWGARALAIWLSADRFAETDFGYSSPTGYQHPQGGRGRRDGVCGGQSGRSGMNDRTQGGNGVRCSHV